MKRVLVLCGESRGYQGVFAGLARAECSTATAPNLAAAAETLAIRGVDLAVIEQRLLLADSKEASHFLEACGSANPYIPVLALLSTADPDDSADSLDVDDFILPPFRPAELAIRVRHLLRRFSPVDESTVIKAGPLIIDLARYETNLEGKRLDLTFKEYELLRFLASSPGNVFTRETLLNKVWGYDYFGGTRTVDVHIRRLRSKIETTTIAFIETVRNVGYRFKEF